MPEIWALMEEVEALTGKPVVLMTDRSLAGKARARVKPAAKSSSGHIISYDPGMARYLNHIIPHECGHLVRMFSVLQEQRIVPVAATAHRRAALPQVAGELFRLVEQGLKPEGLEELYPLWHEGLVTQLVNVPADIHIERWLHREYPGLRREQAKALWSTLKDYRPVLGPEVRRWTPPTIYRAAVAMNYAFTRAVSELFNDRRVLRPYRGRTEVALGDQLYTTLEAVGDRGHGGDCLVTSRWAEVLGIQGWYGWAKADEARDTFYT